MFLFFVIDRHTILSQIIQKLSATFNSNRLVIIRLILFVYTHYYNPSFLPRPSIVEIFISIPYIPDQLPLSIIYRVQKKEANMFCHSSSSSEIGFSVSRRIRRISFSHCSTLTNNHPLLFVWPTQEQQLRTSACRMSRRGGHW